MLERTRSYFEDVIAEDFNYLQSNIVDSARIRSTRISKKKNSDSTKHKSNDFLLDEHTMTRKTRTRRPRISALQSGYCAVCNVPYNSVEDHIQSKKHQKLIGEDANYIALNGSLNGFLQTNSISFLNLNGVDAIGVHDTSLDEFSPTYKKRTMRKSRAASVMCDRSVNPSPLSPAASDITGHHLRSRRNINYMTPPLEDDSLQEKPDLTVREEHEQENKDSRGLRSTTRSLTKLASPMPESHQEEVWNSGRPKRACINKKRLSIEDRLTNCKTYYKVEVVSPKPRSTTASKNHEATKRQQSQSPKRDDEKEKALIVKFKKLRNSELIQLNNEATNFLFPKKDETSEEENEVDCNTTASSADSSSNLDMEDCKSSTPRFKNEDETSMDSMGKKKKRRTHAEAFILDNQKYYKFETPGSSHCRLRYQGSYLPMVLKSPERPTKLEEDIKLEEPEEKKVKYDAKVKLDNYKFAFEKIPSKTGWYNAFRRLDNTEQSYAFFSNYFWESFLLPYQMRTIQPLDRKICSNHYRELINCLTDSTESNSRSSTPGPSCSNSSMSMYDPQDEDSKHSASTTSSICSMDDKPQNIKGVVQKVNRSRRSHKVLVGAGTSPSSGGGKNPRKSPRQHASTLAILSGLIQQRKGRSKGKVPEENQNLSIIKEEQSPVQIQEEVIPEPPPPLSPPSLRIQAAPTTSPEKPKASIRKNKPKIDYYTIARQIDQELDLVIDDDLDNYEIEISDENTIDFNSSITTLDDILGLYEENNSKETEKSCRRFFNGPPVRKPGIRRKKLNKTGWPNKSKRSTMKKEANKGKEDDIESTVDSASVNNDTEEDDEEDEEEDDVPEEASNKKKEERPKRNVPKQNQVNNNKKQTLSNSESPKHRVNKSDKDKILNKLNNSELLQPYVCVQKLDSKKIGKKFVATPKRTIKRQRRMPGSPKSPRMLRKPRGRWYRER